MTKSNLFAIDLDASLRAVAEANADLVAHHGRVMDARSRVPGMLATEHDIDNAKRFVETLKSVAERCRRTRLEDTKPLRSLVQKVESFFKTMEAEAAQARTDVKLLLTEAARRKSAVASSVVIHSGRSGEVLATVASKPSTSAAIPTAWEVVGLNRASVDLETLRPYLTDAALMTAAKAHLKANGPHRLSGASYAEQAIV
jgi:hypothetical protein